MGKRHILFGFVSLLLLNVSLFAAKYTEPNIIPRPLELTMKKGKFSIDASTKIYIQKAFKSEAKFLAKAIRRSTGKKLKVVKGQGTGIQFIKKGKGTYGKEAYSLKVTSKGITIEASHGAGAFYAVQTLLQSLPSEVLVGTKYSGKLIVPAMVIKDEPRFSWRSLLVDEGRYFKGKKYIKRTIDQLAAHKMNILHWHLTEDQGWRIEIKKYPKLTSIGSKRKDTQIGGWGSASRSGEAHEGFYTQKEIKEIVKYAKKRHIMIVPEIGMPGHASAAVAAYPELGTVRKKIDVPVVFGKLPAAYNAADEKVYKILSEILDEVVALFPGSVIHIGGDEVKFDQWKASKEIQALMKREGLKTVSDVQIYFTNRMSKIIAKKNRRMMGWNEILGDDLHGFLKGGQTATKTLDKSAIIHFWKGSPSLAKRAIEKGHDVINSTHNFTYLDYGYGSISLGKAYSFDPIIAGLDPKYHHKIKGFGCQMWSEWTPTVERLDYQMYPRLSAYAETGWTAKSRKDFKNFKKRMEAQEERWDLIGIQYAKNQVSALTAADFFNHVKVGTWNPQSISSAYQKLSFDVSSQIQAKGSYEVVFLYHKGVNAVDIKSVALYENNKKISEDKHLGFSGGTLKKITYKVDAKKFKKAATYTLKASMKGSGGKDSNGEVKIITL